MSVNIKPSSCECGNDLKYSHTCSECNSYYLKCVCEKVSKHSLDSTISCPHCGSSLDLILTMRMLNRRINLYNSLYEKRKRYYKKIINSLNEDNHYRWEYSMLELELHQERSAIFKGISRYPKLKYMISFLRNT